MKSTRDLLSISALIHVPRLPNQIELSHIKEVKPTGELLLLTSEEVACIKVLLRSNDDGYYSKHMFQNVGLKLNYGIIKLDNQYYAVYLGIKHKKQCGSGSFGTIKLLQHLETGNWCIVKVLSEFHIDTNLDDSDEDVDLFRKPSIVKEDADKEYESLKRVDEAIGRFERKSQKKGYQQFILMNYIHGMDMLKFCYNLLDCNKRTLSTAVWLRIAIQLCDALSELHDKYRILHHDIKYENIIYDPMSSSLRFIDYGLSRRLPKGGVIKDKAYTGTGEVLPPEYFSSKQYSVMSEVYSLGVTIADIFGFTGDYSKLIDENSAAFKRNVHIKEDDIRLAVFRYLRDRMMSPIKKNRPRVQEARNFFEKVKQSLTSQEISTYLDVAAYSQSDAGTKSTIIADLLRFDKVTLINTQRLTLLEIVALQKELSAKGVILGDMMMPSNGLTSTTPTSKKRSSAFFQFYGRSESVANQSKADSHTVEHKRKIFK
jgi:serine/threonine protein kinase